MRGIVTDIQRFSLHDGPGIRTTVFLKGCPLRCAWCHNPETLRRAPQLRYWAEACLSCGACIPACPHGAHQMRDGRHTLDFAACRHCLSCVPACPAGALSTLGREMTVEEVLATCQRDRRYYERSGGGVTFSGGEPFAQSGFLLALLEGAKALGLHTCVETSLFTPNAILRQAMPLVDLFLADWKHSDPKEHRRWTGQDHGLIRENLQTLHDSGAAVLLRCPIIPGVNDTPAHYQGIAALLESLPRLSGAELMAYHHLGAKKYADLGLPYALSHARDLTEEQKEAALAAICGGTTKPVWFSPSELG